MNDMTAFERRVADAMMLRAGPARPVDDLAVFDAVLATDHPSRWGFTMFSAVKFVVASVIVALFGGFLLSGILTTGRGEVVLPAAVTDVPSPATPEESVFPSGAFVSEQDSRVLLEFHQDGTGFYRDADDGWEYSFPYAVEGDLFTRLPVDWGPVLSWLAEADTWRWDYDGARLDFHGTESEEGRRGVLADHTFRPIEDPRIAVVAATDLQVGEPILDWQLRHEFVPLADVGPMLYRDPAEFLGRAPGVPIAKGQPLTLALVGPPAE